MGFKISFRCIGVLLLKASIIMWFLLTKENAADHDMKTQNVGKLAAVKKRKQNHQVFVAQVKEIRGISGNFQFIR